MTNEDKSYEQIAKELQESIDERKAADHLDAMKSVVSAELASFGYKDAQHENALAILEPFVSGYEDEKDARVQALKLHHVLLDVSTSKKSNSFFK